MALGPACHRFRAVGGRSEEKSEARGVTRGVSDIILVYPAVGSIIGLFLDFVFDVHKK